MRWLSARALRLLVVIYACTTGVLAIGVALVLPHSGLEPTTHFVSIGLASIAAAGLLVAIAGVWSATGVYMAVFWCFHFGLVVVMATGYLAPGDLSPWEEEWALSPYVSEAAGLALAGAFAFASGACLMFSIRSKSWPTVRPGEWRAAVHEHGFAGSLLVCGAIATWAGIVVASGGPAGFFASYEEYLQNTAEFANVIGVIWPVMGCGLVMSVTGRKAWYRTTAVIVFGCFALLALPLGLRSEVMFPAVAVLIALARGGKSLTPAKAIGTGLAILLIIPIVREVRESGLRGLASAALSVPGLNALIEMGGSLHPVEKVVRWHAEGEPYLQGASYWAPLERGAARLLPGVQAESANDDLRLMNVLVLDRIGPIGFSPVAEAYRNFGPLGVVAVIFLLGVIVGAIDTVADSRTAILLIAAVYVPLLINVRNSFVSVPAQCALGLTLAAIIWLVRHVVGSVLSRPHARLVDHRSAI
jgi:hypothetical protein